MARMTRRTFEETERLTARYNLASKLVLFLGWLALVGIVVSMASQ